MKISSTLIFLLLAMMCGAQNSRIEHWQSYSAQNFSVRFPPAWELDTNTLGGMAFTLFTPPESESDAFRENISLEIQELKTDTNLESYAKADISNLETTYQLLKVLENSPVRLGKVPARRLIYTASVGGLQAKFTEIIVLHQKKAYILLFTADQPRFELFQETAEAVFSSFKLN